MDNPETKKFRLPIYPLALIVIGVTLLLQTLGAMSWLLWLEIWRLWPLVLIALGIYIFLRKNHPVIAGATVVAILVAAISIAAVIAEENENIIVQTFDHPLQNAKAIQLKVDSSLGALKINSLPRASQDAFSAQLHTRGRAETAAPSIQRDGDTLYIDMKVRESRFSPFRSIAVADDWTISLSQTPEIEIRIDTGASSVDLDLTNLRVNSIDVDAGAASIDIEMPQNAGLTKANIDAGVSSIDIRIPQSVQARIATDAGLSSVDVDERFVNRGEYYESAGYEQAANRLDLNIDVGASSISVR